MKVYWWVKSLFLWLKSKYILRNVRDRKGANFVRGTTKLTATTFLGYNTNMNGLVIKGKGKVYIGDNFHSGEECLILSSFHDFNGTKLPYDETSILKTTIIEENVWFGSRVTILGGVKIGEGAIIQAGSVVVRDVEPLTIVGGAPAKVFSKRNESHYFELKESKKYH